jgi:hypoxanthine phosphoribosyltransferase
VTLLAVMSGAIVFLADLLRQLSLEVQLRVMCARSYEQGVDPGLPQLPPCLEADLAGEDVLIVDDILDRGATLSAIVDQVLARRPASLKTCLLLRKIRPAMADAQEVAARKANLEFVGFEIPDIFVVGYGLDFNGRYRNLPDIVILQQQEARP